MARLTRRAHRLLGLVLLVPICGWAVTGFVFFVKPGYAAAYAPLDIRRYPLGEIAVPNPPAEWLEVRQVRTVLGDSLLVKSDDGWRNLDPGTLRPAPLPDEAAIRRLVQDAIGSDGARYGDVASVERRESEATIETTTGARIDLDWATLSFQQSGRDTRLIDGLYRVHYLQWTGIKAIDRVLGVVGLASLLVLAAFGLKLALTTPARP